VGEEGDHHHTGAARWRKYFGRLLLTFGGHIKKVMLLYHQSFTPCNRQKYVDLNPLNSQEDYLASLISASK
jgi:hypothetical protein